MSAPDIGDDVTEAPPDYNEQGLNRLLYAIENGPTPEPPQSVTEALEASHCAAANWDLIMDQLELASRWDRGNLALTSDGFETDTELSPRQAGARTFLRHVAACLVDSREDLSVLAGELHGVVYGDEPTDVTWQDLRVVLEGRADQPSVLELRAAVRRLRDGETIRHIAATSELPAYQVEGVSNFLGIKLWRQESKRRAAEAAVRDGHTARQLAADYTAWHPGADALSERRARELMAEFRQQEAVA